MKRKGLHKKAWDIFSKYIRLKNADWRGYVNCYTCNVTKNWKELHAGHFKHNKLDFDERNVHPQCVACNTYKGGKLDIYATRLVEDYGKNVLRDLERDSSKIYTEQEMKDVIIKYTKKLKKLL